jgi:hypothetical protein
VSKSLPVPVMCAAVVIIEADVLGAGVIFCYLRGTCDIVEGAVVIGDVF